MIRLRFVCLFLVLLSVAGAACGDDATGDQVDGGTSPDAFVIPGLVVGSAVPTSANVIVAWSVASGSPDYSYKFGEGSSSDEQFSVTLVADPPPEAINANGVGVGILFMVPADIEIPDGIVDVNDLQMMGASDGHVVIWRGEGPGFGWSPAFSPGYSCGVCVQNDHFEPVDCTLVELSTDLDEIEGCNWI